MSVKPRNPYPVVLRRLLRKVLPHRIYRRHIGRHEDESMRLWRRIAASVSSENAILDIGAFHGEYALAAKDINPTVPVYAFEPNPRTLEVLRVACEKKGVEIRGVAVGERNGTLPLKCASAQSKIAEQDDLSDPSQQVCYVTAVTLDSWISENAVVPSLIKIDVEGAEAGILRVAKKVLTEYQPIILCEVLTDSAGDEVMAALPPNYRFYYIDENNGTEEETRITRRYWRNKNWLFVPKHRQTEVSTQQVALPNRR